MNILWLSHNIPYPPKGGVLQRNYHLLREIARRHQVTLVAFNQASLLPDPERIREAVQVLRSFCERVEWIVLPSDQSKWLWRMLVLRSMFTADPYSVNWLKSEGMTSLLKRVLSEGQFDLVHLDTIGLVPYLQLFQDIPKVLNHHNIESDMMDRRTQREKNPLKKAYFFQEAVKLRRLEKRYCRQVGCNLVVSSLDKRRLERIMPNSSIEVVPNGVDTSYFQPHQSDPVGESLVMVGGMSWYPNREAVLYFCKKIWPLVLQRFPAATLKVVGRHPPREMVSLARADTRISILGYVDDIRPHVQRAAVYVCAIRDGGGTRLKILDAMALGKAIVCTSVACEGIEVAHERHLLVADKPAKFAQHIADLFEHPAKRVLLEKEARALAVERYQWSRIADDLNIAYTQTVRESATREHTSMHELQELGRR